MKQGKAWYAWIGALIIALILLNFRFWLPMVDIVVYILIVGLSVWVGTTETYSYMRKKIFLPMMGVAFLANIDSTGLTISTVFDVVFQSGAIGIGWLLSSLSRTD